MAELDPLGPILGVLFDDGSSDYILKVLSLAGVPGHFGLSAKETYSNSTRKRAYLDRLPQVLTKFSEAQRIQVAENVARELGGNDLTRSRLEEVLHNVGWTLSEGKLTALAQAGKPARGGAPTPDLPQHAESDGPAAGSNAPRSTLHLPAQPTAAFPNASRIRPWDPD